MNRRKANAKLTVDNVLWLPNVSALLEEPVYHVFSAVPLFLKNTLQ